MTHRNQLEPPSNCDNCNSRNIRFTLNAVVYNENKGDWPYCYHCSNCDAMVGCHPNTNKPLGLMATGSTRRLRKKVHILFDPIWQLNYLSRDEAYEWLAGALDFFGECHIGLLSKEELRKAIDILKTHESNQYSLFKRRKEKRNARARSSKQREGSRIVRRKYGEPYKFK